MTRRRREGYAVSCASSWVNAEGYGANRRARGGVGVRPTGSLANRAVGSHGPSGRLPDAPAVREGPARRDPQTRRRSASKWRTPRMPWNGDRREGQLPSSVEGVSSESGLLGAAESIGPARTRARSRFEAPRYRGGPALRRSPTPLFDLGGIRPRTEHYRAQPSRASTGALARHSIARILREYFACRVPQWLSLLRRSASSRVPGTRLPEGVPGHSSAGSEPDPPVYLRRKIRER